MLGHALIFEGLDAFADYQAAELWSYNNAFTEAGLPWLWDRETIETFGDIGGGAERIRLYAAEMSVEMTSMDIDKLNAAGLRNFTARTSRFGITLRPGVEHMIMRARKKGSQIGMASRHALAPTIRLYAGPKLALDALGPDVAAVARLLKTVEMDVVGPDTPVRIVEREAA